ncbi:MAG: hypothetical protein E7183_07865 [Erysipelotrichaceae bacterium]|nr:hypothetical protein [Erysipelotrichaceae bacterium]
MKIKKENNVVSLSDDVNQKKKYGVLLKRKRQEHHMTLENLCQGICTVSYLSRIENNLVDVEEKYYISLFKKLDIDFNELKEAKENEIFTELLKCYLQESDNEAIEIISDALKSNFYVEIEMELMVLYDNIIHCLYSEALRQILDFNNKTKNLMDNELNFFLFLTALYAYRTNQAIFAYRQIVFLCETQLVNSIYKYAVFDLALDIFDNIGAKEQFLKYYSLLINDKYSAVYPKSAMKHQAQKLLIESYLLKDEEDVLLDELYEKSSGRCKEEIAWQILKKEYKKNCFVKCLEFLQDYDPTPKLLALEALLVLRVSDIKYAFRLEERRKKVIYRAYDESFELMYLIAIQIKRYEDYRSAYDLFKKLMNLQNEQTYCAFLFDEQTIMFIEIALNCGKNKDALKLIMNILKGKLTFPYFL